MKQQTPKCRIFWLLTVLCTLVFSGFSVANPLDDLKKVGEAKLKVLFWDVYNSSLYSKTGEYQAEQFPQALKINYLRDIDAEDLIERTKDEWEKLEIKQVTFSQWIPLLTNIFPDIKKAIYACNDIGLYSPSHGFLVGMPGENIPSLPEV